MLLEMGTSIKLYSYLIILSHYKEKCIKLSRDAFLPSDNANDYAMHKLIFQKYASHNHLRYR